MNITEVKAALNEGHCVQRSNKNNQNGSGKLFLRTIDKRKFLFVRAIRPRTGEVIESPATFDWDDINATNWVIV